MSNRCVVKYLFFACLYFVPALLNGQVTPLKLTTGELTLSSNEKILELVKAKAAFNGNYFWIARFSPLPTPSELVQWQQQGFSIQSKLDAQTWLVSSATPPSKAFNLLHHISAAGYLEPALKISPALQQGKINRLQKDAAGKLSLLVGLVPGVNAEQAKQELRRAGIAIDVSGPDLPNAFVVNATAAQISQLAEFPFLLYIQPVAIDRPLNEKARALTGAFRLNAPVSEGGFGLKGAGVVIGVGDDGDPSFHPDLTDRIINRTPGIVNSHGAHVTGTVAGAGILQPDRRGMAPLATIVSQFFSGIWLNAAAYVQDFGMVLTNNSYAAVEGDCEYNGVYDLYSQLLDQQAFQFPQLLHVFASGNSGDVQCVPLPQHYNTILGSYQPSKNVITVGRTDYNLLSSGSASSGPVRDGRLKPEITSLGIIESTDAGTGYFGAYGTSQSAPSVTGGLALLYERYRQLFGGNNPHGALMKTILLNGARDIGLPGPDYRHGYGFLHLENSIRILNNHRYFGGLVSQGGAKDSVVNVPAGSAYLKVMLYWHDPPAHPLAFNTLMNDLDLEVIRPDGVTVVYPKVLKPSDPGASAVEGQDHINNAEQVIISAPLAGNYTIRVKGYNVLTTPTQAFYVSFDYVPTGLFLRTPIAGDNWSVSSPDEFGITGVIVSWDDEGTPAGTYTLEYSLDNGAGWNLVTNNIAGTERYYGWRPPAGTATNEARVRISKNGTSFSSTSDAFTILNRPSYTVTNPCEGYITVTWNAVTGADDYEVIMKQGPQMVPVAVVAPPTLSYTISGLSKDSTYYVGVRARKGGVSGRWNKANPTTPAGGACAGTLSDGDLKLDSITSPIYGRQFTSNSLGASENVQIRVKNLDNAAVSAGQVNIKLSVDGGPYLSQPSIAAIAALGTYVHTFSGVNLSATGAHTLKAVVENLAVPDKVSVNDTFTTVVKNLPNAPVVLSTTLLENFESAPVFTLSRTTYGLPGLDRWDYFNSDRYARARSFVNTGIASSGQRAITLDVSKATPHVKNPSNNLYGTFNLSNYTTANEARIDFLFKQHGSAQAPNAQNKVWIRGSDTNAWIEAYDLGANQPLEPGVWKRSVSLELNDLLSAAGQQFTSSTQIRIGQSALFGMADNAHFGGYSFDDVRLYIAVNDLQMLAIDTPAIYSCGLNNSVPVTVKVRNSTSQPVSGVQVSYSINATNLVTETIPVTIPANSVYNYTFLQKANLSATGAYAIEAKVILAGDNVADNDVAIAIIYNQPVIAAFPYFENFEAGNGNYFISGLNASWQYGTPASLRIDTAASGTKVWKTRLIGGYNDNEVSYLHSPCFNISALNEPVLSFAMAYDLEDCAQYGVVCDAAWVEYSADGLNWQKLGSFGTGTNWYNVEKEAIWSKRKQTHWHVATAPLPKGLSSLRLRFVMKTDEGTNYEGIAIDDIHIYDRVAPLYTATGTSNAVTQTVDGTAPVHFLSGNRLIASVIPNNNNLGNTEVKAYIFGGPVRNYVQQYYGNRNITIKPTNTLTGNATVRFYFTDKEVDSMRLANTCSSCPNPKDYTHLGVTQYTDANKANEDGDLLNNTSGIGRYIYGSDLKMVPYDAGYYAEFSVSAFSEFWLNDGRGLNQALPGRWLSFNAVKQGSNTVKLTWAVSNESGISNYEIQVAGSQADVNANNFVSIGSAIPKNTSPADYTYLDERPGKAGDHYYRIKQLDSNGKVIYSPVILVKFALQDFTVKLYPNPVPDNLTVSVSLPASRDLELKIFNMAGQLLYSRQWMAAPGVSTVSVPFNKTGISKGVYTMAISDGQSWWYGKVVKQ